MSSTATIWAARQQTERPTDKLVLWAMADQPMQEGQYLCFASVACITEFTGLDRKTVLASLARLKGKQIIDTGERRGRTGQVIVWRLAVLSVPETAPLETVPETEQYRKRNGPVFPSKESQKRDTEPEKEPERRTYGNAGDASARADVAPEAKITGQRGRRIDPDWQPTLPLPDRLAKAVAGWPPGRVDEILDEFRDFWIADAGKRATKLDWDRTWWNRLRAVIDRDGRGGRHGNGNGIGRGGPGGAGNPHSPMVAAAARAVARGDGGD